MDRQPYAPLPKALMIQTAIISIGIWLFVAIVLQFDPQMMVADGDTEWHIAAGDLIRLNGALPVHDPWSFTAGSAIWYNISWMWDVAFSALYEYAGWHGVIAMNAMIYAALLASVFFVCVLRSGHGIASFIIVFSLLSVLQPIARPMTLGLVFVFLVYALLELVQRGWLKHRCWWIIPALMPLWVNIHGSFIMGMMLMGMYGLVMWHEKKWQDFYYLFLVGCVSLVASLINPYGIEIYYSIWENATGIINQTIAEWQPLALKSGHLIGAFFITLFFALMVMCQPTMCKAERLTIFILLLLTLPSQRMLAILAIVASPVMASAIAAVVQPKHHKNHAPAWLNKACEIAVRMFRKDNTLKVALAVALLVAVILPMPVVGGLQEHNVKASVLDLSEEVGFIQKYYPDTKFYTDYNLGGTLIFQFRGEFPVFIDGRATTAYPKDLIEDYVAFSKQQLDWTERFSKRGVDGIMIYQGSSGAPHIRQHKDWQCVYSSDKVDIHVRSHKVTKKHENACLTY